MRLEKFSAFILRQRARDSTVWVLLFQQFAASLVFYLNKLISGLRCCGIKSQSEAKNVKRLLLNLWVRC